MPRKRSRPGARSKARGGNWRGWRNESERSQRSNMLSQAQRTTILELNGKGVSSREIARVLKMSRLTVRKVVRANSTSVPEIRRAEKAEPYRQQILDLLASCKGNLVRVHEELKESGAELSYQALTGFCRRQGIGQTPIVPAGQYHFEPRVELQHDTSPHEVEVGGKKYKAQTASAVLCYSRLLFFQINPTFQRFDCKLFLTDALRQAGGVPERVMIDNTRGGVARHGAGDDSGAGDGGIRGTLRIPLRGARDWGCESFGARGASVLVYRKQLSGGPQVRQLGGSESTGASVVRQGQLDLQEIYPRRATGTVRGGAPASESAAGVDSGSVPSACAHGGCGRLCLGELGSLLGAGSLDRTEGGGSRDAGQDRDRTGPTPPRHACPRGDSTESTDHAVRPSAAARGRRQTKRSAPGRAGPGGGRTGGRALCGGAEAEGPQSGGSCPAATVAFAARISARAVPGRGARSRPVWTLRSRPGGADDSAPRGARLLSAGGNGAQWR